MKRPKKLPKIFRKPLSKAQLHKKVLKKIYIESEREFLNSKLELDQAGNYFIDPDKLEKADFKRLRSLAKSIKKNRGLIVGWKAAILVLILAVILGFNLLLKDRLIEQAAEKYLQQVFKAKVDLQGPQVRLLAGTVSFDRLIIADARQPMRNLSEIGASTVSIDTGRLLSRKLIINEISCREIQFHTARETSGALEAAELDTAVSGPDDSGAEAEKEPGAVAQMGALGLEIGTESAQNLIDSYKASLESPTLIETTTNRYRESRQSWEARAESVDDKVEAVRNRSEQVLETDVSSIDSIGKAKDYLEQLQSLKKSVQSARDEAESTYDEFQSDTRYISRSREAIETAIEKDVEFLEEAVGSFSTDSLKIIAETAKPILREKFGTIFDYGERIASTHSQLKSTSTQKKSKFEDGNRRGTMVRFPMRKYPKFLLKHFEVSAGQESSSNFSEFIVRNITGDQEVLGEPTTVIFSTAPETRRLSSNLTIDSRESSDHLLQGTTTLELFPLEMAEGLDKISINSLNAQTDTDIEVFMQPDLSGRGKALVKLYEMDISFQQADSELDRAIQTVLGGIETTELSLDFEFSDGNISSISVESELDTLLSARVADYARQRAEEAAAQMEDALYEYIDEELSTNEALSEDLRSVGQDLRNDIQAAESLEQLVEKEQQKVEAEIRKIQDEVTDQVKDQAGDALEDLGNELDLPGF